MEVHGFEIGFLKIIVELFQFFRIFFYVMVQGGRRTGIETLTDTEISQPLGCQPLEYQ